MQTQTLTQSWFQQKVLLWMTIMTYMTQRARIFKHSLPATDFVVLSGIILQAFRQLELHIRSSSVITKIIWHQHWHLKLLLARKHGISKVQVIFALKITVLMFQLGFTILHFYFLIFGFWFVLCEKIQIITSKSTISIILNVITHNAVLEF